MREFGRGVGPLRGNTWPGSYLNNLLSPATLQAKARGPG